MAGGGLSVRLSLRTSPTTPMICRNGVSFPKLSPVLILLPTASCPEKYWCAKDWLTITTGGRRQAEKHARQHRNGQGKSEHSPINMHRLTRSC